MMNINILNKVIKGIADQIPLVHSFYTQTPYESWNVKEVKYGSVSFVVTETTTNEQTTSYNAVMYYADRLTEDKSNLDSVHSDAATVIQTIVGALNQSDDEYILVDYPVGITLFEQSFCDNLAGGYANVTINVEAMGECFTDEYSVPEIIGTSAYYTKDEIETLFPLREQLSTVAYSGSFNDLKNRPDLVNKQQYNELYNAVLESTSYLAKEINGKVSIGKYDEWSKTINTKLASKIDRQAFDNLYETMETVTTNLAVEIKNKVSHAAFDAFKKSVAGNVNQQQYNELYNAVLESTSELAKQIEQKVSKAAFNNVVSEIEASVATKAEQQSVDSIYNTLNSAISDVAETLNSKVNNSYFDGWKSVIEGTLNTKVSQQTFDDFVANVITKQNLDTVVDEVLKDYNQLVDDYINTPEFKAELESVVNDIINSSADYYTKSETYTKQEVDDIISNIDLSDIDLSAYAKNDEVYKKSETYSKTEIDAKLDDVEVDLSDYPTKSEVYTKYEIDDKLDKIGTGGTVDLSDYYKKSETYSKTEIDAKLDDVEVDLSDYYKKSETYSKTEINSVLGDINTILNNILYVK